MQRRSTRRLASRLEKIGGIPWPWIVAVGGTAAIVITTLQVLYPLKSQESEPVDLAPPAAEISTVTALGRLEPQGEVIRLTAPSTLEGNRLESLVVKEGDRVEAGQVLAILDRRDRLQANLEQAQNQVKVAAAKLAQVRAGAKVGAINAQAAQVEQRQVEWHSDLKAQSEAIARLQAQWQGDQAAQQATINRLQAEEKNAAQEYQRYQQLADEGAISTSLLDSKRLALDSAQQRTTEAQAILKRINTTANRQIREAQAQLERTRRSGVEQIRGANATLDQIAEVRPTDVATAESELKVAQSAVKQAQANLDQAYIRAPRAGQILNIYTWPGETPGNDGIVDLGQTRTMFAIAEIYESDIRNVQPGQTATITSIALDEPLRGTVTQVGFQVKRQEVVNTDPATNIDARVVDVKIQLDPASSQQVAQLTNLQVKVVIDR